MPRPQSLLLIALAALLSLAVFWAFEDGAELPNENARRTSAVETGALRLAPKSASDTASARGARSQSLTGAVADGGSERGRGVASTSGMSGAGFRSGSAGTREAVYLAAPSGVALTWGGRIRDGILRADIAGAKIVLSAGDRRAEGISNEDGIFAVQWVDGLPADLKVEHESYLDLTIAALELEPAAEFELLPSATIHGRLTPVPPVAVEGGSDPTRVDLWQEQSKSGKNWPRRSALVNEFGEFSFPDLDPGNYSLCAFAGTWTGRLESGVQVDGGESEYVELTCAKGASLKGSLVWGKTPPARDAESLLAGVTVKLSPNDKGLPKVLRTEREISAAVDGDGTFTLEGIAPGNHRLSLETPWGSRPSFGLAIDASGDLLEREFKVLAPGSLAGFVLDAKSNPVMGAIVSVVRRKDKKGLFRALDAEAGLDDGSPLFAGPVVTDADGAFYLGIVPVDEELLAVASAPSTNAIGAPLWSVVPAIAPGELRTGVWMRFEAPRHARGRVRLAGALEVTGEPLEGVRIRAFMSTDGKEHVLAVAMSDEDGSFELGPLMAGNVRLAADLDGHIDESFSVMIGSGDLENVDLYLERALGFSGVVIDEDGAAVSGVRVRVSVDDPELAQAARKAKGKKAESSKLSNSKARLTTADEFGRFRLEELVPGTYFTTVSSPVWELVRTFPRTMSELDAEAGEAIEVVVRRRKSAERCSVSFSVLATMTGLAPDDLLIRGLKGQVSTDGIDVRATGLKPGRVRIDLTAKDCVPKTIGLQLAPGEHYPLGLVQLDPGAKVTVTVKSGKGGQKLPGAKVRLIAVSLDDGGVGKGTRALKLGSVGGGRFRANGVPLGNWLLRVDYNGYTRYTAPFVVDELSESTSASLAKKRP